MASTRFFLDTRGVKSGAPAPLKVAIAHQHQTSYITTTARLFPHQWDEKTRQVINHPDQKMLNVYITGVMQTVDRAIIRLADSGELATMKAKDVKDHIMSILHPEKAKKQQDKDLFAYRFRKFADSKSPSTRQIYMHTYSRMLAFAGEQLEQMRFEDITKEWLTKFEAFLSKTSPSKNARNIHLRNIRAVVNEAINDDVTSFYAFRRFPIRPVATPKRNLKVEELRKLINYPCEPHAVKYVDMFKLMFMLVGINSIDLAHLKEIHDGRIEYNRAKTHRFYSIKVEPEALEIIERYRGEKWLLDILDHWRNHKDFTLKMNRTLKKIGEVKRVGRGGKKVYKPLFPKISTYWARHTWATIAASLDIPKDTISHALGHGNNTVTDIYIDFDQKKVDEANRKVLDWVLYGKRKRSRYS